ncbi:MAG: 2-oxoacid:acceptor oxidoreductase family protein, partial [Victivallales bacterium]|nr:2-oxoacid:acceptor oxidoreductase family protein [Victivallales bacterium]
STEKTNEWINEVMAKEFPVQNFRDNTAEAPVVERAVSDFSTEALDKIFDIAEKSDLIEAPAAGQDVQVKIAGFGGQGVLSLGIMLTQASMAVGRETSWYPSYGPEQRGGTSNCSVTISDEPIGSPVVYHPDLLVALNRPSLERFKNDVKKGGVILYDAIMGEVEMPEGVRGIAIPAQQLADEGGNSRGANTVMFSAICSLGITRLPAQAFEHALNQSFAKKPKLIPMNAALFKYVQEWMAKNN